MTGFARAQGEVVWLLDLGAAQREWPRAGYQAAAGEGLDGLELPLRDLAAKQLRRGNVSGT